MFSTKMPSLRILSLVLLIALASPASADSSAFTKWLCKVLGINSKTYNAISKVRDGYKPSPGARLVRLDLRTKKETTLWQCDECWSPATVSATDIALIKPDGIWIVPAAPNKPRLLAAGSRFLAIIGLIKDQPNQLLVAQDSNIQNCKYVLRQVDLNSGQLRDPSDLPEKCLEGPADLYTAIKAGRLLNDEILLSTRSVNNLPRKILRGKYGQVADQDSPSYEQSELLSEQDQRDDGIDRFDPNWVNENEIIYMANP
jgi:hypothetical protein